FSHPTPTTSAIYTLSLHDALPISPRAKNLTTAGKLGRGEPIAARDAGAVIAEIRAEVISPRASRGDTFGAVLCARPGPRHEFIRSEEHTSELQSRGHLVCRLLLEK